MCLERDTIPIFQCFCQKFKLECSHVETLDKLKLRISLQNKWPMLFEKCRGHEKQRPAEELFHTGGHTN